METGLLHLHSFLRWVAFILIVITIIKAFTGWQKNGIYSKSDDRFALFTLIAFHLQLVIGLILYFLNGWYHISAETMGINVMRFFSVEHTLGMLIAIILVTVGRVSSKKIADATLRHKRIFIYYFIALIIVLISIPWSFREVGAGRGWF